MLFFFQTSLGSFCCTTPCILKQFQVTYHIQIRFMTLFRLVWFFYPGFMAQNMFLHHKKKRVCCRIDQHVNNNNNNNNFTQWLHSRCWVCLMFEFQWLDSKASCSRSSKICVSPVSETWVLDVVENIDSFLRWGNHMYQFGRLPKYAKKKEKLIYWKNLPCWELTYPTYETGKSSGPSYL